jgi:hypothetical protein
MWSRSKMEKVPRPNKPYRPTKRSASAPHGRTSTLLEGQAPHHKILTSPEGQAPPRVNHRLARGLGSPSGEVFAPLEGLTPPRVNLRLARGLGAPSGEVFALLEGLTPPRTSLLLAQGTGTPERVSASLEAALDPRVRTCSPDRSIKCPSVSQAPESNVNSHHAGPSTPLGNHISALFHQPALCDHSRRCVGRPVSFHNTVPPAHVPPPRRPLERGRRHPQKGYDHLLCTRRG